MPAQHVSSWVVTCQDCIPLGLLQNAEHAEQMLTNGLAVAVSAGSWVVHPAVSGFADGLALLMMLVVCQRSVSGVLLHQLRSSVQRIAPL